MSMDKPNGPGVIAPTSVISPMPIYIQDPSIRGESFDQLLNNRGVRFLHKMAVPCPNMTNLEDNNHRPNCPFCDDSGIIYYTNKEIYGVFQSNSLEKVFERQGIWEIGTAVVTLPSEYSDGTQADFNTYDKLIMPDFEIRIWQLLEYETRSNRVQKLRYPIVKIDYMLSIVNNVEKVYVQGVDFNINVDGNIEWVSGHEPHYDPITDLGEVLTISYFAHPVYNVLHPMRELRVTQQMQSNGSKIARRLPQQILVRRDFLMNPDDKIENKS